ncbi:MAG: arsenic efflux protein [Bacteroidales bacterium]|nr:arsenic efflux protein [Bacteroidales bacterium]MCM1415548.1 arsenic efflux protein [bacterium]MCM1424381.1 arsenic efflux protein [bacterium]
MILDVIYESYIDSLRLLPFLFLTYLVMECLEHWTGGKMQAVVRRSGKAGPAIGGLLGAFPQCGFSTAAANLYAGRIISLGTLLAVFLSTSDEMIPVMISENAEISMIAKLLLAKIVFAVAVGFLADFLFPKKEAAQIGHFCEKQHCHCEKGIWRSAASHTWKIFLYIILVSLVLNFAIAMIGEESLAMLISDRPVLGLFAAALVGMIPNCASSVVLTHLYLEGVLGAGPLFAGLLAGSGVGYLVLLRVNEDKKDNLRIFALLYAVGVAAGAVVMALGVRF